MSEAERLADLLDVGEISKTGMNHAADELRRLSAINAELLEALKAAKMPLELYNAYGWPDRDGVRGKVKAAIAKAEGGAQ